MEMKDCMASTKQDSSEAFPSSVSYVGSRTMSDFNSTGHGSGGKGSDATENETDIPLYMSICMPASPSGLHIEQTKRVILSDYTKNNILNGKQKCPKSSISDNLQESKEEKFHFQPIDGGNSQSNVMEDGVSDPLEVQQRVPRSDRLKDKRYDSFKTWSGKLERQLSALRGKPCETGLESDGSQSSGSGSMPGVDRYFAALEGPELDTLRASEELALPDDKRWPFLLRFPISAFGMCLGVSSQAILWKTLATALSMRFLHISLDVNLILWCISLLLMTIVSLTYTLKIIFYFEAVRREYYHPIRVNFFFAPWIACLFLAIGVPPSVTKSLPPALWYVLMAPLLCLEIKLYGQWMLGGKRRLSKVANPSNHLSIVGNFVGALLGASMGLKEGPTFFFAVGLAHYIVLFVTLYQRLPTNETLPKDLHPVFFLFVAAPSVACLAWAKICGEFGYGSKIAYFIAMFLYVSLAVRINFFRGFRFSLAWWAYTFPMTGASIATIRYSNEVKNVLTQSVSVALSAVSTITVMALLVTTIVHAFVLHDIFPNDISIAITGKRLKLGKKRSKPLKSLSLDIIPSKSNDKDFSILIDDLKT